MDHTIDPPDSEHRLPLMNSQLATPRLYIYKSKEKAKSGCIQMVTIILLMTLEQSIYL